LAKELSQEQERLESVLDFESINLVLEKKVQKKRELFKTLKLYGKELQNCAQEFTKQLQEIWKHSELVRIMDSNENIQPWLKKIFYLVQKILESSEIFQKLSWESWKLLEKKIQDLENFFYTLEILILSCENFFSEDFFEQKIFVATENFLKNFKY
jgi:uncharacterized coiled-coil DUF342 family protein